MLVGPGDEDLVHAVRGFCKLAPPAIIATVVGGIIQVWRLDGMALLTTGHGRLSILSGLTIAAAIYLGTATRQFARKRLADADHLDGRMAHRLRRAFTIECLLGILALLFTAWMLTLTPPKTADASEFNDTTEYAFTSPTSQGSFEVRLQLTSTQVGPFGFRLEVFAPSSGISDLQVKFVPPPEAYTTTNEIVASDPARRGRRGGDDRRPGHRLRGPRQLDGGHQRHPRRRQSADRPCLRPRHHRRRRSTTTTTVAVTPPPHGGNDRTTAATAETTTPTSAP